MKPLVYRERKNGVGNRRDLTFSYRLWNRQLFSETNTHTLVCIRIHTHMDNRERVKIHGKYKEDICSTAS